MEHITPQNDTLWTCSDIAVYLQLSKSSVQSRIVPRPGFPTPVQLARTNTRRWIPAEVKAWALTQKQQ